MNFSEIARKDPQGLGLAHEPPNLCLRLIEMQRLPSFEPETKWLIFRQLRGQGGWLRRLVASGAGLQVTEVEVHQATLTRWWDELGALYVSLQLEGNMGLDGTTYSLEAEMNSTRFACRWWGQAPEGWAGLERWFHARVVDCEKSLGRAPQGG